MTDTEALVERIYRQSKHISTIERDNAITGILDFIATTYSANNHHKVNDLISFIQEEGGSGNASIIGYEVSIVTFKCCFSERFYCTYIRL
ncbi:hypothetical protein NIT60_03400 [Mammaliicoccus sciuri]|nr:hypothetical protein NIT60_03400 [Mammaliicoccus sciuri]